MPKINLRNYRLYEKTTEALIQFFSNIYEDVTALDLGGNGLGRKTAIELMQIFMAIPSGVAMLDLSANGLGKKTAPELAQIFKAIPSTVTLLNLSNNSLFNNNNDAELVQIFKAIPSGVITLDLSANGLEKKIDAEWVQIFEAIPSGVTTLHLSDNNLEEKTAAELIQIFKAIPSGVTTLHLSSNDLNKRTGAELTWFFQNFSESIKSLKINDNIYTPPSNYIIQFSESKIQSLYQDYVIPTEREDSETYTFATIKPAFNIDEKYLLKLITNFEQHPNPQSDLICALLLEGRIENYVPSEKKQQSDSYQTQRRLYALDFLRRAACTADEELATTIEEIVLHIKSVEPKDSLIFEKLSLFIFSQEKGFKESMEEKSDFIIDAQMLQPIKFIDLQYLLTTDSISSFSLFSREKNATSLSEEHNTLKKLTL